MIVFLKGFLIGAIIAFPIGPIGILCLQRLLTQGAGVGIASGMGGATADILFASIGVMGLSIIAQFVHDHIYLTRFASSIFLCLVGTYLISTKPTLAPTKITTRGILQAYFSTLFLTLANPLLIFSFAAFFALFSVDITQSSVAWIVTLMSGIWLGSTSWWLLLGSLTAIFRLSLKSQNIHLINRFTGTIIIIIALVGLLYTLFT